MRHIEKKEAPQAFVDFVKRENPIVWDDIHNAAPIVYTSAREALKAEQNNMCGYTEIYFAEGIKGHIDHFVKREHDPHKTFDWQNFIYATRDDSFGARYKDTKIAKDEYGDILNPVVDHPENYFEYNYLGEILPKEKLSNIDHQKAKRTIELFNLNHPTLCHRRSKMVLSIDSLRNGGLDEGQINEYLTKEGFISLREQFLGAS